MESVSELWLIGDWPTLAEESATPRLPALNVAAYCSERGALKRALADATESGVSQDQARRFLLSGAYNSLGRVQALCGRHERAREYFRDALEIVQGREPLEAIVEARRLEQLRQIGIAAVWCPVQQHERSPCDVRQALRELRDASGNNVVPLIALAEQASMEADHVEAIRLWQQVAAELGPSMPQAYYERLRTAYSYQMSFPRATPEEEAVTGDGDKHALLHRIHDELDPGFYLEIGVQHGASIRLAKCRAIGVDPMPLVDEPLPAHISLMACSSDRFFEVYADYMLLDAVAMSFIDGMHLFEYALRDFMNVEQHSNQGTLIVLDDIFPNHPAQAQRSRRTRAWAGDIWKISEILREYRPDLDLLAVDARPTGLLLVKNLDPSNTVLFDLYDQIVAEYSARECVPDSYLNRKNAVSTKSKGLKEWIDELRSRRTYL